MNDILKGGPFGVNGLLQSAGCSKCLSVETVMDSDTHMANAVQGLTGEVKVVECRLCSPLFSPCTFMGVLVYNREQACFFDYFSVHLVLHCGCGNSLTYNLVKCLLLFCFLNLPE